MRRAVDQIYTFEFTDSVPLKEVEATLLLAIMGTESIHGSAQVRLDTGHYLDASKRCCVIDGATEAGKDLCRLFVGYLTNEYGEGSFRVSRPRRPNVPKAGGSAENGGRGPINPSKN